MNTRTQWTPKRQAKVYDMRSKGHTIKEIADAVGCSYAAAAQAVLRFYGRVQSPDFSNEDDKYIIDNYYILHIKKIAAELGRTPHAIRTRAVKLGATKPRDMLKNWSDSELNIIKEFYPLHGAKYTASKLNNRTPSAIYKIASRLKLKRVYNK